MLARVFEEAGLATVGLSLVRQQAVNVKAPRFLHVEFPLGRPLGRPGDADFQRDVIRRAFALLERTDVPVLEDHPEVIVDDGEEAASCTLPPPFDPNLHPAIDEAKGLIPAYRRQVEAAGGRTALGRVGDVDAIADLITAFIDLSTGSSLADVGMDPDSVRAAGQDVRAFYEEAGLSLSEHVPGARQIETWFYTETKTGAVIKAAAAALREAGEDRNTWYYLAPGQHTQ
ncbi:MAG: hypothetical protein AAF467_26045 [Actinomycetota bacterium]